MTFKDLFHVYHNQSKIDQSYYGLARFKDHFSEISFYMGLDTLNIMTRAVEQF